MLDSCLGVSLTRYAPHFIAKDAAGKPASEKRWEAGAKLGHEGALGQIVEWLKATYGGDHRLVPARHRVVFFRQILDANQDVPSLEAVVAMKDITRSVYPLVSACGSAVPDS